MDAKSKARCVLPTTCMQLVLSLISEPPFPPVTGLQGIIIAMVIGSVAFIWIHYWLWKEGAYAECYRWMRDNLPCCKYPRKELVVSHTQAVLGARPPAQASPTSTS